MEPRWLDDRERAAWLRLVAVTELLPSALDAQLRRAAELTHYDYFVLAMLSETDDRTLTMSTLAHRTNATLPRLSHVVRRLEARGLVERSPDPADRRVTRARLTDAGMDLVVEVAPTHVEHVREHVLDALTPEQVEQLADIADALVTRLDPEGRMSSLLDSAPRPGAGQAGETTASTK